MVATKPLKEPHPYQVSKGPIQHGGARNIVGTTIWLDLVANGTPVDGTSGTGVGWAGPGSTLVNSATGKWYVNTGTAASPTWTVIGSVT